jgi:ATP adenylyltransferase
MTFDELMTFIEKSMRMSHIYQPVMIRTLLDTGGTAAEDEIARNLLSHDVSQIEYYSNITRNMVGRVLRNHGIVERERETYRLVGFDSLTAEQREKLKEACDRKLDEYIERRGKMIWQHRRRSSGYISGTDKYEVLKAAKFRCELCGIPADEHALEVDHIIPRNKGGADDPSNLQALCYRCNAMKRDRDDTDFRSIRESYDKREEGCAFCNLPPKRIVMDNNLAVVIRDKYPVFPLHSLIIPKRHVGDFFDLGTSEMKACNYLLQKTKDAFKEEDGTIVGFNVGANIGEAAGQTIFHCHIHLIPRRKGDVENPRGGVRHVMPGKGYYGGD